MGNVNVGPGKVTDRKPGKIDEKMWDAIFTEAVIDPKTKAMQAQKISGVVYQKGKPVADYQGDQGFADQTKQVLILRGNVQVKSKTYNATLYCDTLRYEGKTGKDGRIRAQGHIRVVSDTGNLTSQSEIWATPDLTQVGTPEVFDKL